MQTLCPESLLFNRDFLIKHNLNDAGKDWSDAACVSTMEGVIKSQCKISTRERYALQAGARDDDAVSREYGIPNLSDYGFMTYRLQLFRL